VTILNRFIARLAQQKAKLPALYKLINVIADPATHGRMIDRKAVHGHHLLEIARAQ